MTEVQLDDASQLIILGFAQLVPSTMERVDRGFMSAEIISYLALQDDVALGEVRAGYRSKQVIVVWVVLFLSAFNQIDGLLREGKGTFLIFDSISKMAFAEIDRIRVSRQRSAYAIRPSRSIGVLYDHRDEPAELARLVVLSSPLFRDVVEMERSTLSMRSRKLRTSSLRRMTIPRSRRGRQRMKSLS
jgi:hypothetical protein